MLLKHSVIHVRFCKLRKEKNRKTEKESDRNYTKAIPEWPNYQRNAMQKLSANSNSERSSIITMLAIIYYAPLPYKIHTSITIYIVSIVSVQNSAVHTVHTYTHQHSTHSCIRINIIQYRTRTSDIIKIRVVVQNRIELNQS